ncbi:hypothetical protein Pmani_005075 [Petrolisthes manimaculis]|uniref:Uncharacterized protein n=1 Tax=Petrolisthes manimaculis TaxID=1843537 RepID=A0AAE1QDG4_9EUCA|nr:hypothetical protein Pmani_005075 [Petrolisthes manimaculis]
MSHLGEDEADEQPPAYHTMYPNRCKPGNVAVGNDMTVGNVASFKGGSGKKMELTSDQRIKENPHFITSRDKLGSVKNTEKTSKTNPSQTITSPDHYRTNIPRANILKHGPIPTNGSGSNKAERRESLGKNETEAGDGSEQEGQPDDSQGGNRRRDFLAHAATITHRTKEVLVDFCNKTTAHGFSHIVKEGQSVLMKVFWLAVTLTGLVLLLSACYDVTVTALVSRGTSTEVIYHDLHTSGLMVPYMTICSLAGFWKSKLAYHNVSTSLASYLLVAVRGKEVISPLLMSDSKREKVLQQLLRNFLTTRNLTLTQMVNMLSPEKQWWQGSNCCSETFQPTLTSLGRCYTTINTTNSYRQTISGLLGGHRIIFAVNSHEYIEYDHHVVSTISLAEAGIHVSLSNYDITPSVATSVQALRIAPNTAASIALTISTLDRSERFLGLWPWSQSSCVTHEQYGAMSEVERAKMEHNLYFHSYYRTCPLLHSNCTFLAFRFTNDTTRVCYPWDVYGQLDLQDEMAHCLQSHLNKHNPNKTMMCQNTMITQQQSHTTLLREVVKAQQGITIKPGVNVSMMNVYYPQLGYTEYRERVPTIFTWFSKLGGQMGLFLGASFITVVEVFFTSTRVLRAALTALCTRIKSCTHCPHPA